MSCSCPLYPSPSPTFLSVTGILLQEHDPLITRVPNWTVSLLICFSCKSNIDKRKNNDETRIERETNGLLWSKSKFLFPWSSFIPFCFRHKTIRFLASKGIPFTVEGRGGMIHLSWENYFLWSIRRQCLSSGLLTSFYPAPQSVHSLEKEWPRLKILLSSKTGKGFITQENQSHDTLVKCTLQVSRINCYDYLLLQIQDVSK